MNDRYVKKAALVAGLVLWPLCTLAAEDLVLVFMVKNKGAPVSRDVPPREAP